MNYMYNATDRKMSKFVDNNRRNNEGYYFRVPEHTNNLFVQENTKQIHFFGLHSVAKRDLAGKFIPCGRTVLLKKEDRNYISIRLPAFELL